LRALSLEAFYRVGTTNLPLSVRIELRAIPFFWCSIAIEQGAEAGTAAGAAGAGSEAMNREGQEGEEEEEIVELGTEFAASSAALFPPVCPAQTSQLEGSPPEGGALPLFSPSSLQSWLLLCCQVVNGGLRDKPGTSRDHYHTCYCLSGLSVAQHGDPGAPYDLHGNLDNILERCAAFSVAGSLGLCCIAWLPRRWPWGKARSLRG
jgi:hypothetical protein